MQRRIRTTVLVLAVALTGSCGDDHSSRLSSRDQAPGPSRPPVTSAAPGPDWVQRQGQAALDLVTRYPWRRLGWKIQFTEGESGIIAETQPTQRLIQVHVRQRMPLDELAHALAHEIGHAHDLTHLDDACRTSYKAARGVPDRDGWLDWQGGTDYGLPGGDYAEVFALWAMDDVGPFKGTMAPRPPTAELAKLSRFFDPAGCRGPR